MSAQILPFDDEGDGNRGENKLKQLSVNVKNLELWRYKEWTAEDITAYFISRDVPIGDKFIVHKIYGDILDDLNDDDYQALGFECLGDLISVRKAVLRLLNEKRAFPSYTAYLKHRWDVSNIKKYYNGEDLTLSEADNVVNSLALVNALILTVPFSVVTSLGSDYWENLYINIKDCPDDTYEKGFSLFIKNGYATAYSAMTSLLVCIFYYILRPREVLFSEWWRRGKYAVAAICTGSLGSIISMLVLYGTLSGWYTFRNADLCDTLDENKNHYNVGVAILIAINILCVLVMA